MADLSVGAWDELHESEASQASVFCFDNVFIEKSCLFVDLVCFFSLLLRVALFLNATRSDRSVHCFPLTKKVDQCNGSLFGACYDSKRHKAIVVQDRITRKTCELAVCQYVHCLRWVSLRVPSLKESLL